MSAIMDDDASFFHREPEDCWHEKSDAITAEIALEKFHDERLVVMVMERFELRDKNIVASVALDREQVVSLAERLLEMALNMKGEE